MDGWGGGWVGGGVGGWVEGGGVGRCATTRGGSVDGWLGTGWMTCGPQVGGTQVYMCDDHQCHISDHGASVGRDECLEPLC